METPSQPTLSRIALGALDVNKHLNSPLGSPKKSPVKKHNFVFSDDGAERAPVGRSLKEQLLETAEVQVLRETPVRVGEVLASPRSEKRKEAPTDVEGREEGSVKVARIEGREMGSLSLGSEVDAVLRAASMEGDEGLESTQATSVRARTPSASLEVSLETSHSTTLTSSDTVPNSARESPTPTTQANTTESELRENASALRLRLKFAMYKLKTNQHDIPLSRLELLSSPPKRCSPPARPTIAVASPPHDDEIEEPGSATPRPRNRQLLDLDLNVEGEGESPEKMEMLTPLPRHMQVEAAAGGEEELTSSGVKGRAADGLLSLMGVRE
ncbi:hypothetical protein VE00_09277 [Pseudogymnoascus sp. WSF 3629]|nr:hypothetical protein VE00_09277 [Pseudogymnoascus sp. WSF 3629]